MGEHTHTQPFYGSVEFVWDNPGEPVPEETFTHSHSSQPSIIPIIVGEHREIINNISEIVQIATWLHTQLFYGLLGFCPGLPV